MSRLVFFCSPRHFSVFNRKNGHRRISRDVACDVLSNQTVTPKVPQLQVQKQYSNTATFFLSEEPCKGLGAGLCPASARSP